MIQLPVIFSDLESFSLVFETFLPQIPREIQRILCTNVYTWIGKRRSLQFQLSFRKQGLLNFRVSHIQVSVNEVISWKRCQIESLDLLRTSNKKWYMAIEDRQFRWPWVTFKVIPTASLSFLSNVIFCTAHKISTDIARRAVLFSSGTSCLILGFQSGSHVWRADWYWGVY